MSVYFITCRQSGAVKIGRAFEPRQRLAELQVGNPFPLAIEAILDGGDREERQLHAQFSEFRIRSEWFHLVPEIEAIIAANPCGDIPKLTYRQRAILSRERALAKEEEKYRVGAA